jgi:hypothetical protein
LQFRLEFAGPIEFMVEKESTPLQKRRKKVIVRRWKMAQQSHEMVGPLFSDSPARKAARAHVVSG